MSNKYVAIMAMGGRERESTSTVKPEIIHTLWQMQKILIVSNHGTGLLLLYLLKKGYNHDIQLLHKTYLTSNKEFCWK